MGLLFHCQFWLILWLLKEKEFCLFVLRFFFFVPFPILLIIFFLLLLFCAYLPLACAPLKKIEVSIHNFLTKKICYILFYLMRI